MPTGDGQDVGAEVVKDLREMAGGLRHKHHSTLYRQAILMAEVLRMRMVPDRKQDRLLDIADDIEARIAMGEKKYGTRLRTNNGRDVLLDAYQEILDFINYVKQAELEGAL